MAAPDSDDMCGTCPTFAKAPKSNPCAEDESSCTSTCTGATWCEDDSEDDAKSGTPASRSAAANAAGSHGVASGSHSSRASAAKAAGEDGNAPSGSGRGGRSSDDEDDVLATTHDCDEGYDDWEIMWSKAKQEWCCEHEIRGCKTQHKGHHKDHEEAKHSDENIQDGFCCLAGLKDDDMCGTCFGNAIAESDTHCGGSRKHCEECGGSATWCSGKPSSEAKAPSPGTERTRHPVPVPRPTSAPTPEPEPTNAPTPEPEPTSAPTPEPEPTTAPSRRPTAEPTPEPTPEPEPTAAPTPKPTPRPPTSAPTPEESEDDGEDDAEEESGPFCCLAGLGDAGTFCGKCFNAAKAFAGTHCGSSRSACESCGGGATWCAEDAEDAEKDAARRPAGGGGGAAEPDDSADDQEAGECCLAAADFDSFCDSCYPTAWAKPGGHCGGSRSACESCSGRATWCATRHPAKEDSKEEVARPGEGEVHDDKSDDESFCCLAGSNNNDICGSCFSTAIAKPGSHCGDNRNKCETCGGKASWCQAGEISQSAPSSERMDLMLHLEDGTYAPSVGETTVLTVHNRTFPATVIGGKDMLKSIVRKVLQNGQLNSTFGRLPVPPLAAGIYVASLAVVALVVAVRRLGVLGRQPVSRAGVERYDTVQGSSQSEIETA